MSGQKLATDSEGRADDVPELWKVDRVCEVLGLSPPTVYRMMEAGELPYVRFGKSRRVKKADVLRLIEERTVRRV